jgi:hypothetical protein
MSIRHLQPRPFSRCPRTGKYCHPTQFAAQKHLQHARMMSPDADDQHMRTYRCQRCNTWHVGRDRGITRLESNWEGVTLAANECG